MKNLILISFMVLFSGTLLAAGAPYIIGGSELPSEHEVARSTVYIEIKMLRATSSCSGIILTDRLILTAAHCLGGDGLAELFVHFTTNIKTPKHPIIRVTARRKILETPVPPYTEFDNHDLAILKLASPIPEGFEPAVLTFDKEILKAGSEIFMAGFGRTNPMPYPERAIGVGVLRIVQNKLLQFPYGETEVLISIRNGGTCGGDSGGPALIKVGEQFAVFGVASRLTERDRLSDNGRSRRYACTEDIVYTSVAAQQEWIEATVKEMESL